jgi:hypothetical protein
MTSTDQDCQLVPKSIIYSCGAVEQGVGPQSQLLGAIQHPFAKVCTCFGCQRAANGGKRGQMQQTGVGFEPAVAKGNPKSPTVN